MKIAKLVPQVDHLLTGILIKANEWLVEFLHLFVSLLLRTAESLHQFYLFSEDFAQIWSIVPLNLEWLAYSDLDELEEANKSADIIQNVTRKGRLDKEFSDQVASSDSVLIDINLGEDCHALLNALCFQILYRVLLKLHPRYLNSVGGLHFVSLLLKLGLSFDHFWIQSLNDAQSSHEDSPVAFAVSCLDFLTHFNLFLNLDILQDIPPDRVEKALFVC